jgi:hypothetical protein
MHILNTNNSIVYVKWIGNECFSFFRKRGVKVVKKEFF